MVTWPYEKRTFDSVCPPDSRTLRTIRIERPPSNSCAIATKLYCPPTPLTARPSSRPSDATAPNSVATMPVLRKRAWTRSRRLRASSPYSWFGSANRSYSSAGWSSTRSKVERGTTASPYP